jgi:hypothetical protein
MAASPAPTIFLLGPRGWPGRDPAGEPGLQVRRDLAAEGRGARWVVMEDDLTGPHDEPDHAKFLRLARGSTHVFIVWPRGTEMEGTMDEVVLLLAMHETGDGVPAVVLFHERGALQEIQERSPYLKGLLGLKPALVEWTGLADLRRKVRERMPP